MTTPFSSSVPGNDAANASTRAYPTNVDHTATEQLNLASPAASSSERIFEPTTGPPSNGAPAPTPPTEAVASTPAPRLRSRFGTIVWGVLLLVFAVYLVVYTLLPVPPDPTLWLLGGVIAVGLGLVVAGIAAAARRAN